MPAPEPPKPELSYLNIAIGIPLQPIEKAAEDEVPRAVGVEPFKYKMGGGAAAPACGIDGGYSITRAPLAMSGSGEVITTSVDLSYWLKGRKQVPCPGQVTTALMRHRRGAAPDGERLHQHHDHHSSRLDYERTFLTRTGRARQQVRPAPAGSGRDGRGRERVRHGAQKDAARSGQARGRRIRSAQACRSRMGADERAKRVAPERMAGLEPGRHRRGAGHCRGRPAAHRCPAAVKTSGERRQEATVQQQAAAAGEPSPRPRTRSSCRSRWTCKSRSFRRGSTRHSISIKVE